MVRYTANNSSDSSDDGYPQKSKRSKKHSKDTEASHWLDAIPTNEQIMALTESKLFLGVREWLLSSGAFDLTTAFWAVSLLVVTKTYGSKTLSGIKQYGTNAVHLKPSTETARKLCDWVAEHGQANNTLFSWCALPTFQQVELTETDEQQFGGSDEDGWDPNYSAKKNRKTKTKLGLQASKGKSIFFFGGKLFMLERSGHLVDESQHPDYDEYGNERRNEEQIVLRCFWGNTKPLSDLLQHVVQHNDHQNAKLLIHSIDRNRTQTLTCRRRPFSTIDQEPRVGFAMLSDLQQYFSPGPEEFYSRSGLPYRRGWLLYGPSGSGKSSLTQAIASEFSLDLYHLILNDMTDSDLFKAFEKLPTRCVVVIEDIDACNILREESSEKAKVARELDEARKHLEKLSEKKRCHGTSKKKKSSTASASRGGSYRGRGRDSARGRGRASGSQTTSKSWAQIVEAQPESQWEDPSSDAGSDDEDLIESSSDAEAQEKEEEDAKDSIKRLQDRYNALQNQEKTHITFSGLLNAIDGPGAKEGRFLVLTTNAIKSLDGALRRYGRCDKTWFMGRSSPAMAAVTFRRLFGQDPCRTHDLSDIHRLSMEFGKQIAPDTFAPCEIQEYCVSHRGEPEQAVSEWQRYVQMKASGEDAVQYDINDEQQGEPDYLAEAPEGWDKALDGYDMYMEGLNKMTERKVQNTTLQTLRSDYKDPLAFGEMSSDYGELDDTVFEAIQTKLYSLFFGPIGPKPSQKYEKRKPGVKQVDDVVWPSDSISEIGNSRKPSIDSAISITSVASTDGEVSDLRSATSRNEQPASTANTSRSPSISSKLEVYQGEDHQLEFPMSQDDEALCYGDFAYNSSEMHGSSSKKLFFW
jgi:hypothetical protein